MVAIDPSLLVEGLFADIAVLCVGKVLAGLDLEAGGVLDVGSWIGRVLLCCILTTSPTRTDLPRMLFSRVSEWKQSYRH